MRGVRSVLRVCATVGVAFLLLCLCAPNESLASEMTGFRKIISVGCHLADGTCFAQIDGARAGGSVGCAGNSIRWDIGQPNGKTWLSLILSAFHSKKKVNFKIHACFQTQPSFPTFSWGYVQ